MRKTVMTMKDIFCGALISFLYCIPIAYCETIDFSKACSPSYQTLRAEEGFIYSPGFKENKTYPPKLNCTFVLHLLNNKNIKIEVKFMDLEESETCTTADAVKILIKHNERRKLLRTYCGSNITDRVLIFENQTKVVYITFHSDYRISKRGFLLYYTQTTNKSLCEESELQCRNAGCVPKTVICNLKDDCGDGTDEQDCKFDSKERYRSAFHRSGEEKLNQHDVCGSPVVKPNLRTEIESRIVGEHEAVPGSWPWQAEIELSHVLPNGHTCGGSLINSLWVVTAAHCIRGLPQAVHYRIHLGSHHKYKKGQYDLIRYVKSIHVVDYRTLNGTYQQLIDNDLALLRMNAEVKYNDHIRPVCLPPHGFQIQVGTICYSSGWGASRGSGLSSVLKQVPVKILETCNATTGATIKSETMICAEGFDNIGGACHGDSGGPLVCKVDERWYLIGVVSFVTAVTSLAGICAVRNTPFVYHKVSAYNLWIENIIRSTK